MNTVQLIGRLTKDPEAREGNGHQVAALRLAVNGRDRNAAPDYVDVVAFDGLAKTCTDHLEKGRQVRRQRPAVSLGVGGRGRLASLAPAGDRPRGRVPGSGKARRLGGLTRAGSFAPRPPAPRSRGALACPGPRRWRPRAALRWPA